MNKRDRTFALSFTFGLLASLYFFIASSYSYLTNTMLPFPKINIIIHGLATAAILAMGLLYLTAKKAVKKK